MKRYIVWIKPCWNDSSCFIIDLEKKEYFWYLSERFTRIKHDKSSILRFITKDILDNSVIISSTKVSEKVLYFYYILPNLYKYLWINSIKDLNSISNINKLKLIKKKVLSKYEIPNDFNRLFNKIKYKDHHLSHIYASYFFSWFKNNILGITMDAEWDGLSSSYYYFQNDRISTIYKNQSISLKDIDWYDKLISIGSLYSLFTKTLWFYPQSDEWKVEALSSYWTLNSNLYSFISKSIFLDWIKITFNLELCKTLFSEQFLLKTKDEIGDFDFAHTIQYFLENFILQLIKEIIILYPKLDWLVLGWGVFKNIKLNYEIFKNIETKVYIPVFSWDEWTWIWSALLYLYNKWIDTSFIKIQNPPYFWNKYSNNDIKEYLFNRWFKYEFIDNSLIFKDISLNILKWKIIWIFQWSAEFWPRSLWNRAILANAYDHSIKKELNDKIKKRDYFQPFCPSILESDRKALFEKSYYNNIMSSAFKIKEKYKNIFYSILHIDGTSRPQFVKESDNNFLYNILLEIKKSEWFWVCLNTSFNIHWKTIVENPDDCFDDAKLMGLNIIYFWNYKVYIN